MNTTQLAPVWVEQPGQLSELARALTTQSIISVDTESNSLFAYHEQVCLIQFSTDEHDYLVDTLALPSLDVLAPVFADPHIEKVFHAAEYDIICLKRDYGFQFANIFDTMLAARIVGWQAVGLGSILEKEFDVLVDKKYQRADWSKRPLSDEQIDYARHDTHYLVALRNLLRAELMRQGRLGLALEDFNRLTGIVPEDNHHAQDSCWRLAGNHGLEPDQMAVLNALCLLRDRLAQTADKPPFKIFGSDLMVELARSQPQTVKELEKIKGFSRYISRKYSQQVLETIKAGPNMPLPPRPRHVRPSNAYMRRYERLRDWRKDAAKRLSVESDIILPKDILEEIATANPRKPAELEAAMRSVPWRFSHFGAEILQALLA